MTRALIVAAPRSGAGKTTVTLALAAAFRRRGIRVRTAKSGPDFIDPAFHEAASGAPSLNLDSWAMPPALLEATIAAASEGADLLVIESAMGLFDGVAAPRGRSGMAADLASLLSVPVLLVLDVSGQSQSAAAVARGFALHDPAVRIAGVVLNRIGSERHRAGIAQAMAEVAMPVRGAVMRRPDIALPERHLGLVQAREHGDLPRLMARLADLAEQCLDLDAILADAGEVPPCAGTGPALPPPGQRIAIAEDAAFSFFYPHLHAGWRRLGAELLPFSPLADAAPPAGCDVCWLPGGYPELHAPALAASTRFLAGLQDFARTGAVHGECGGYMVLGEALQTADGAWHRMAGLLGHTTSFARRRLHLGYRQARLLADCAIGAKSTLLRGHEYHHTSLIDPGADPSLVDLSDSAGASLGPAGGQRGRVSGTYFHVIAWKAAG